MHLRTVFNETILQFTQAGISSARLDGLLLLEDELGKDRAWILAHLDDEVSKLSKKFAQNVQRRIKHEPLAYILSKSEFYGREFSVNDHTLVPRPETETMIDLAKKRINEPQLVVDVGCGSGAIGLTVLLENLANQVILVDIDDECLRTSKENAAHYKLKASFIKSNLLMKVPSITKPFSILANLPYVPDSHTINRAAMQEPKHAIFGGKDGMDLYRKMFGQISKLSNKPELIFTESLPFQHAELASIAESAGYYQINNDDFIQIFAQN